MNGLVAAAVLASACGRVAFDAAPDGSEDSAADPDLLLHFAFETTDPRVNSAPLPYPAACTECPTITAGRVGVGAALFDGTQCLEIPGSRDLMPAMFTFAAWARPRIAHHATILGRAFDGPIADTNTFEIWVESDPTWNVAAHEQRVTRAEAPGAWHHYAGTYDGFELAVYEDGARLERDPAAARAYTPDDVTIGCDLNFAALVQRFDGIIDDVRLYSRALPPAEVAALAQ